MIDSQVMNNAIRYIVYSKERPQVEDLMAFGLDRQQAEDLIDNIWETSALISVRDQGVVGCSKRK